MNKDRPILFSGPMVRALLDGSKTQTRRVVKPQPTEHHWQPLPGYELRVSKPVLCTDGRLHITFKHTIPHNPELDKGGHAVCPYGQPGDRLWVREAWRTVEAADNLPPRDLHAAYRIWYEADNPQQPAGGKLRPSMFMPRWASRITLEIVSVRVERLQDISHEDAEDEGWNPLEDVCSPLVWYAALWESINGPGSWAANPLVWVVEFKRTI